MAKTYYLSKNGEPLLKGTADELAIALGCKPNTVRVRARYCCGGGAGYEVTSDDEPVVDCCDSWSPNRSELLAAMRSRNIEEREGPRWEL